MDGLVRTPAQDRELNVLLGDLDRVTVALWKLGYDPRGRVSDTIDGTQTDGVARGCSLTATVKDVVVG